MKSVQHKRLSASTCIDARQDKYFPWALVMNSYRGKKNISEFKREKYENFYSLSFNNTNNSNSKYV